MLDQDSSLKLSVGSLHFDEVKVPSLVLHIPWKFEYFHR